MGERILESHGFYRSIEYKFLISGRNFQNGYLASMNSSLALANMGHLVGCQMSVDSTSMTSIHPLSFCFIQTCTPSWHYTSFENNYFLVATSVLQWRLCTMHEPQITSLEPKPHHRLHHVCLSSNQQVDGRQILISYC